MHFKFFDPLGQDFTPQKCKTYLYSLKVIVSDDLFRFSLSFSASFWAVFVEPGAALLVHAKNSGTKLLCSTSKILCWYFNGLTLMIFVGVTYSFRAELSIGVENSASKKFRLIWHPQSPFASMSSRASFSVWLVCCESFRLQRLKFRLYFNIMAFIQCRKGIANFIKS